MSVIQDALRRKLDEQRTRAASGERPERTPAPPQAPPVAQQVIQNETRAVRRARPSQNWERPGETYSRGPRARDEQRTVQLLLGFILVMLVAAFVGAVLYFLDARDPPIRTGGMGPPPPASVPVPPRVAAPAPSETPPAAAPVASPVVDVVSAPAAAPVPMPPPPVAASVAPAPAPVQAAPSVTGWPLINVGGVLAGSSAKGSSAILNGEWIRVRQKIEGVRLTAVSNEGVTLEFNGESRFVETGNSTDDD